MVLVCVFFFFKQKTAYEMRISDWSSDVCSSDLFMANPALNSLIVAVLVFGILYTFRQVLMIGREASWVEDWKKTQQGAATGNAGEPSNLLAPLAKMLESPIGRASWRERVSQYV